MKQLALCILIIFFGLVMAGCTHPKSAGLPGPVNPGLIYPDVRFVVISDLHFYDTSLGIHGKAFQDYLDNDRKLLVLSDEIIATAMEKIAAEKADFVLVAGDLTKDGEKICHEGVARHLQTLVDSGKQVFVVPGNHDINNPESVRFTGDTTQPVPTVTPDQFRQIYQGFGYGAALASDASSLSYMIEPIPGIRILALDSNRYKENKAKGHAIVGGVFSPETLAWIETQLAAAKEENKPVMVFQHHGIMEHYPANEKFYDEYLVANHEKVTELFARYGVGLVFTGHFHAQDITRKVVDGQEIFDIETGSLVTAPCPYRVVTLGPDDSHGSRASVTSQFITSIPSLGEGFADYAADYVFTGTQKLANNSLTRYKVSREQQPLINAQVAAAYTAHLKGDEQKPEQVIDIKGFGLWLKIIAWLQKDLIHGWWTDLAPRDNELVINLDRAVDSGGVAGITP